MKMILDVRPLQGFFLIAVILLLGLQTSVRAEEAAEAPAGAHFEIPAWFKNSFLDLRDDVATAAAGKRRLIIYIGQDGCPYCRELLQNNFSQKAIVDYTRKHFDVLAINMWGDAEITDFNGQQLSEKKFAEQLKVQFTPTLLFFDEAGKVVLRVNGYFPPHQLKAALEYVAGHHEKSGGFRAYYNKLSPAAASGSLHSEPYLMKPPYRLANRGSKKPLMVLFEQKVCAECDILHADILNHPATPGLMEKFDVVQLDMWGKTPVVTPDGKSLTASDWAKALGVVYAPSVVMFDANGKEQMRIEAMLKTFHFQSVLEYIASGAYREQANFQRYIEERSRILRETGTEVDIWK